ncbi:hypothetical protein ACI65C_013544 [Semiaphis heraclei]
MPCYANNSYQKYHEKVYSHLFNASLDEIKLAGIEKAKLAIQNGEVDDQGRALVTVVADEGYNSVVAKYVGGKRIHFSHKGSYQALSTAAMLSYNAGPKSISILRKKNCNVSPGDFTKRFISRKQTMKICKIKRKRTFEPSRRRDTKINIPADKDYGNCEELDMDDDVYEKKKIEFMKNKIIKNSDEIQLIEKSTKLQSECELWHKERRVRLTASHFGTICNEHTYGIECEPFAKTEFEKLTGLKIQDSGLFIYEKLPFLAASPDGQLDNDGIIEIKCPSSIKQLTPREAIETGKLKFATLDSQYNLQLKRSDKY